MEYFILLLNNNFLDERQTWPVPFPDPCQSMPKGGDAEEMESSVDLVGSLSSIRSGAE